MAWEVSQSDFSIQMQAYNTATRARLARRGNLRRALCEQLCIRDFLARRNSSEEIARRRTTQTRLIASSSTFMFAHSSAVFL